jgi:hypothetical protein
MSYCRFSEADAYIYDDYRYGIVCCACALLDEGDLQYSPLLETDVPVLHNFVAGYDYDKILDHINDHRYNGYYIPLDVDERLKEERDCTHTDQNKKCGICWKKDT